MGSKKVNTKMRLQYIMDTKNLKQVDILNKCTPYCEKFEVKMNKSDLSQYVSGKVEPSQDKLVILGMALNVSEAWLMGFDVPMERNTSEHSSKENSNIEEYISLYKRLDNNDKAEIRGEMKQMLKAEKYRQEELTKEAM